MRELVAGLVSRRRADRAGLGADRATASTTFAQALVGGEPHGDGRAVDGPARLPIDRVFSMKGFGTVVTGTLVSGRIAVDDELAVAPGDRVVKVRGVQVHGQRQTEAVAGQRSAVNLGGVEVEEIGRGQALLASGTFVETRIADASVEVLPGARPLKHGARVRFHQGTAEIIGRVATIGPVGLDRAVPAIAAGGRAFVRLRLEAPAGTRTRRPLHPAGVFTAADDRRRPHPRSATAADGHSQPGGARETAAARVRSGGREPR